MKLKNLYANPDALQKVVGKVGVDAGVKEEVDPGKFNKDGSPVDPVERILHGPNGLDLDRLWRDDAYQAQEMEYPNGRWFKYKAALVEREANEKAAQAAAQHEADLKAMEAELDEQDRVEAAEVEERRLARLAEVDRIFASSNPKIGRKLN